MDKPNGVRAPSNLTSMGCCPGWGALASLGWRLCRSLWQSLDPTAAWAGALGAPEPQTEVLTGGMLPALQRRWEEKYLQGLGNHGCSV